MMNTYFARGLQWFKRRLTESAAVEVDVLNSDGRLSKIVAIPAKSWLEETGKVDANAVDFLFPEYSPKRGDVIVFEGMRYLVRSVSSDSVKVADAFCYSDIYRTFKRCRAQFVGADEC